LSRRQTFGEAGEAGRCGCKHGQNLLSGKWGIVHNNSPSAQVKY
jgi:hypothetical protein